MGRALVFLLFFSSNAFGFCEQIVNTCTKPGLIALTFDDGVTKNYPELLDILDKLHVKATFFIEGQVAAAPSRLPMLIDAYRRGHEVGNHTSTHPHLTKLRMEDWDREIGKTENLIESIVKYTRAKRFMRPPHGEVNDALCAYLLRHNNTIVKWNIEVVGDWRRGRTKRNRAQLWSSFVAGFTKMEPSKNSLILLQHDKSIESVRLVPDIVALAQNRGFKFVSLSECLN